ncbi:ABC transporter permease [Streptosporangium sp. NPDC051022]|uniref:ABC transporter permease n=1 Tax=Streptosporangium sp. NPDC051022 TaxID=3155752 RepID=UPI003439A1D9
MSRYLTRRLLSMLLVLLVAVTLSFAIVHALPGDPVEQMLDGTVGGVQATPEQKAALRHELGLDRPIAEQYLTFLGHALLGDFGRSISSGQPTVEAIADAAPASFALLAVALPLSLLLGVGVAVVGTLARGRGLRGALSALTVLGVSMPGYWLGIVLIETLSFRLPLFPATGDDGFRSLVLPAVTLAVPSAGLIAQVLRGSLRATLAEPYVTTALAKGASPARVNLRHALRNAALPAVTVFGMLVGGLMGGATIVEIVFGRPGLGRLLVTAVAQRDLTVVQAMVVFVGAAYILINLVIDLLYSWLDPRVTAVGGRSDERMA